MDHPAVFNQQHNWRECWDTSVRLLSQAQDLSEWYTVNNTNANGEMSCHHMNTSAQALVYRDGVIRAVTWSGSPNMFSGKQHTTKQPRNETCTHITVNMGTRSHCQKSYNLKSFNIDSGCVTCYNDHTLTVGVSRAVMTTPSRIIHFPAKQ